MKEIKNWEAIIKDENGKEEIGILLPGCIIKGEIDEEGIEVQVIDVDISNLIITDSNEEQYLLFNASRTYLNNIARCMEVARNERDGEER